LEAEEEGKGHLPPGTGLVGAGESLEGIDLDGMREEKNVGALPSSSLAVVSPSPASPSASSPNPNSNSRTAFPSLWPFGGSSPKLKIGFEDVADGDVDVEEEAWGEEAGGGRYNGSDRNHFRGAKADDYEQSSDEDSDEEYGSGKFGSGGKGGKRRLSVTTEAKRRTSLEDDDDEEVVHVGMAEAREDTETGKVVEGREEGLGGDDELVEIQHAEMQGVEEGK
jgi:hypothetical protein